MPMLDALGTMPELGGVQIFTIAALVASLFLLWAVKANDRVARAMRLKDEGWGRVELLLSRRLELVPDLVETVGAYADAGGDAFKSAASAVRSIRNADGPEERIAAERELTEAMVGLMALSDVRPGLAEDARFEEIAGDVAAISADIELAGKYYDGAVHTYNKAIRRIPDRLIARPLGYRRAPFFLGDGVI